MAKFSDTIDYIRTECGRCDGQGAVRNDGAQRYTVDCDTVDCPDCRGAGKARHDELDQWEDIT